METKFKIFDFSPNTINDEERSIVIMASTSQVDRYGDIIEPSAFKLDKIQTLPILLNHNSNQPIGKTLWAKIQNGGLVLKIYISDKTQVARDAWELVKENIISFASVGFIPLQYSEIETGYNFTEVDLIETSLTPTPANSGAIALSLKAVQSPEVKEMLETKLKEFEQENLIKELNEKIIELTDNMKTINEDAEIKLKEIESLKSELQTANIEIKETEKELEKRLELSKDKTNTEIKNRIESLLKTVNSLKSN